MNHAPTIKVSHEILKKNKEIISESSGYKAEIELKISDKDGKIKQTITTPFRSYVSNFPKILQYSLLGVASQPMNTANTLFTASLAHTFVVTEKDLTGLASTPSKRGIWIGDINDTSGVGNSQTSGIQDELSFSDFNLRRPYEQGDLSATKEIDFEATTVNMYSTNSDILEVKRRFTNVGPGSIYIDEVGLVGSAPSSSTATTAGAFVTNTVYRIASAGTTNFTLIGATDSLPGTIFMATGAGTGTGTAIPFDSVMIARDGVYDSSGNGVEVPESNIIDLTYRFEITNSSGFTRNFLRYLAGEMSGSAPSVYLKDTLGTSYSYNYSLLAANKSLMASATDVNYGLLISGSITSTPSSVPTIKTLDYTIENQILEASMEHSAVSTIDLTTEDGASTFGVYRDFENVLTTNVYVNAVNLVAQINDTVSTTKNFLIGKSSVSGVGTDYITVAPGEILRLRFYLSFPLGDLNPLAAE